ncbi:hypothetical protein [Cupriavidus sp. H18C1]|uniref:hypothetical protein n=1 Tax=Cupriavidus sp. H18C1 TaxID=3241601 RepID=UPI003BB8B86C
MQVGANSTVNIRWIPDHLIERIGLFLPARSLLHLFACNHTLQRVLKPLVAWRHCEHLIGMSNTRPQTADDYRHTISAAQPCRPRDRLNIFRMLARTLPCCVGEDERREAASALAEAAAQAGGDFGAARVTTDILRCLGYRQAHRSTPWLADMEASLSAYMQGEPVEKRAPLMGGLSGGGTPASAAATRTRLLGAYPGVFSRKGCRGDLEGGDIMAVPATR